MNLNLEFSTKVAKKILGNCQNAKNFLLRLQEIKRFDLPFRVLTRGKNRGEKVLDLSSSQLWKKVIENWDLEAGGKIIREIFKSTKKYESGKDSFRNMKILIQEWENLKLGSVAWPFSQGDFDGFVQRINSQAIEGFAKDEKVKSAAVKYRRIKEINTVRNDFLETMIFEKNQNIIPTLSHRRGVDFFINGVSYDQKVAKSPTKKFIKDYGENWKDVAASHPEKVAEYLYKYQDEGRFGSDSRLLVVYLDEDVEIQRIAEIVKSVDLEKPLKVNFCYTHNKGKPTEKDVDYQVNCFVILLVNR